MIPRVPNPPPPPPPPPPAPPPPHPSPPPPRPPEIGKLFAAFLHGFVSQPPNPFRPVRGRSGAVRTRSDPFGGQPRYAIMPLRTRTRSEGVQKAFESRSQPVREYGFITPLTRSDPFGYRTQSGCVQRPQGQAKARFCWLVPEPNTFCPPQTPKCLVPYHPKPQNAKFSTTRNSNHSVLDSYHADILLQDIDLTLKLMTCDQFSHQFDMELNGNLQENKHMWSSVCISAESLTRQCSTIPSLVSTHAFSALK